MPKHLYLPTIVGNIDIPAKASLWTNNEKKLILSIADGIQTGDGNTLGKGISSIPDIWARPLMFQSALRPNSNHPLRDSFVAEWRGLLSLISLSKIKSNLSKLTICPVPLDEGVFSTALKNLSPKDVLLEPNKKYSWTDILLIKFGDIPLGAFSPTTLVYTSGNYNEALYNEALSLKDENGFLCPPTSKEDGLEYIGKWVLNLQIVLKGLLDSDSANPDNLSIIMIKTLIDDWLVEIKNTLQISEEDLLESKKVKISDSILEIHPLPGFLSKYTIYENILKPLEKDEDGEGYHSDISLQFRRNNTSYEEIVIISDKTLTGNVRIWNEQRVSEFGNEAQRIIDKYFKESWGGDIGKGNDILKSGGIWIRPELYFLTETLVASQNESFLDINEFDLNCGGKYILPFKEEILSYFSPQDIKKILRPVFIEDTHTVKFSFMLPLNSGKAIKVEKIFRYKSAGNGEGTILKMAVPVLEIFPNYFSSRWRKYFLFQSNADEQQFKPIFFDKAVVTTEREQEEFDPLFRQTVKLTEMLGDNSFPEGLVLINKNNYWGLILIDKPLKRESGLANLWSIGIDFGTSNTNVYKKTGHADEIKAEKWKFDFPKYSRTITATDANVRKRLINEFFVPGAVIDLPIPSTLSVFHNSRIDKLFLDYGIYVPNIDNKYKLPATVHADLKWKTENEIKADLFFESLLYFLLLDVISENLSKIEISCSYPKAYSDTDKKLFMGYWEQVINKLTNNKVDTRLFNTLDENNTDRAKYIEISRVPFLETEGIAAGEYFASPSTIENISERADKRIAALCIDVGGGTTDISVWFRDNIIFDASVLLAGRQISQFIQRNSKIKELLFTNEALNALNEKKNEPIVFAARLNLILKEEEARIREMLIKHANQKEIQWLRRMIAIEFGAIAFYTASICVAIESACNIGLLDRIKNNGIKLHWGGNAAKLISWIDFGKFDSNGIGAKILNAIFINCLNDEAALGEMAVKAKSVSQLISPCHKSEAAGGLVVSDIYDNAVNNDLNTQDDYEMDVSLASSAKMIVCGENIELNNGVIGAFESITSKNLFDGNITKYKNSNLSRLIRFLDILNYFGLKSGLFNEDTKVKLSAAEKDLIKDNILSEFIKIEKVNEEKRVIEPIFIMEIKLLFEILNSKIR